MDGYAVTRPRRAAAPGHPAGVAGHPGRPDRHRAADTGHRRPDHDRRPDAAGADMIVQVERTDGGVDAVRIDGAPRPGVHVRTRGRGRADRRCCAAGGHRDRAAAGRGRRRTRVSPNSRSGLPLQVLVLSTGTRTGRARKAARPGSDLRVQRADAGRRDDRGRGRCNVEHFVADDVDQLRAALRRRPPNVDLIVTSGGVSAGAYEVVKDALTGQGIEFAKVAMQPGMPQGAGRSSRRAVFRSSRCPATRSARTSRSRCSSGRRSGPRWDIPTSAGRWSGRR